MSKRLDALKELMKESSGINSYYDLIAEIVVDEMSTIAKDLLKPDYDIHENQQNKKRLFRAATRILKFYLNRDDYKSFKAENPSLWYKE
ncbi:hypothetical protein UFOVP59_25 [uncultured Caudovirales phage]|uniref:Uncharacterized protein n=1 Tax=uncultured Caudovirales phage TaxID=2100421 RepID=A0A6J5KX67_9CAUD|nr:hypothetical protein UFOVP59_25 [uncultured Caudovirales phage]CAB5220566.1 hypothetical protein UFOVP246_7 [uncultured Caudovirales phage]